MASHARIALVGDRSPNVRAHTLIPGIVDALGERDQLPLDPYWISTEDAAEGSLGKFDGVWLLPGSPYRSEKGAVAAVRVAREGGIPFLGTCGGFQHAVLEYARTVCRLAAASHAENDPSAGADAVIVPLACSLAGHEGTVRYTPGSLAERIVGAPRSVERYLCSYGPNRAHVATLEAGGLRFSGVDEAGEVRVLELPGHPFFVATLFQPELAEDRGRSHPIIRAFAEAALSSAGAPAPGAGNAART